MEKGISLGFAELQEKRRMKGVPLGVFLSFNDRDVHPQCPNACNPYHKCGRQCLDKIPSGNKLLDGDRTGLSSLEWERMSERKGVDPSCPNASNPYHKCADSCIEKIAAKRQEAVKEPGKNKGVSSIGDDTVNPNCKYASNPYHKCDKFCFENNPNRGHHKDSVVNPQCKNTSNPYHVCAEYCFLEVPARGPPGQGMKPKTPKERKKLIYNTEIKVVNSGCKYASNPYHKCAEHCFQNAAELDISRKATKLNEGRKEIGDVSNSHNECTDDCIEDISTDKPAVEALIKKKKGGQRTEISIKAPNLNHDYTDSPKGITIHVGTNDSESEKVENTIEILDTQPLHVDASDLFLEWAKYCSLKAMEDSEAPFRDRGSKERAKN